MCLIYCINTLSYRLKGAYAAAQTLSYGLKGACATVQRQQKIPQG